MEAPSDADVQTFQITPPLVHVRTLFFNVFSFSSLSSSFPLLSISRPPCVDSKRLRVYIQNGSCVPATRPRAQITWAFLLAHTETFRMYTRRRFDSTHVVFERVTPHTTTPHTTHHTPQQQHNNTHTPTNHNTPTHHTHIFMLPTTVNYVLCVVVWRGVCLCVFPFV